MKQLIINSTISFAIVLSAVTAGVALTTGTAEAKVYTKSKYINRDKCYKAKRIPATVEYNTRGKLLRKSSRSWSGNAQKHGAKVVNRYNDPVYIQTSRIVEDQHVTLVPVSC